MKEYIYDNTNATWRVAYHLFHIANLIISAVLLARGTSKETVVIGFTTIYIVNTIVNHLTRKSELTVFALDNEGLCYQQYKIPYNHITQVVDNNRMVRINVNKANYIEIPNIHKLHDSNEFLQELKTRIKQE